MRKTFSHVLALILISSFFTLVVACSTESSAPRPGSVAPDFSVKDATGKTVQLSDLRGNVVLLNFWATWCPPCKEEVPALSRLNARMAGTAFRMVTISIDEGGSNAVESFFQVSGYRLPTLLDPAGTVGRLYGITGIPETFIIDAQGVIRKKIVGPRAWDDPSVISYLEELQKR
ncbi:MAG: TlpA family protein disulfide reductase [Deltaproteobacteria bacterium]|nr:TlpA family protein disulfide reductase [Deltaproteobacteria bacterium]TLN03201.1 MAG: TlpA family protein disulfide reductase [bacterium]